MTGPLPSGGLLPFHGLLPGVSSSSVTDLEEHFRELYPNSIGDEAYNDFGPVVDAYGDPDQHLWVYLTGLAWMFKQVDDIARDGPNGEPGWSQVFDLERSKTEWLPWAGQLVGYQVPPQPAGQTLENYDAEQRRRIVTRSSWRRGTIDMLIEIVKEQLSGTQSVLVQERYGGDPDVIKMWVYDSEVITSAAEITAAAMTQKDAGLLFEFTVLTTTGSYDALRAAQATYTVALSKFVDYNEMLFNPSKP